MFLLVEKIKIIGILLNIVHRQVHKNIMHVTTESDRLHNHSTLLTIQNQQHHKPCNLRYT